MNGYNCDTCGQDLTSCQCVHGPSEVGDLHAMATAALRDSTPEARQLERLHREFSRIADVPAYMRRDPSRLGNILSRISTLERRADRRVRACTIAPAARA